MGIKFFMKKITGSLTILTLLACGLSSGEEFYQGEVMKAADENRLTEVTAKVKGQKEIELRVDRVDSIDSDWSDWINPVFVNAEGTEIPVTKEMVKTVKQSWDKLKYDQSVGGKALQVGGKTFAKGLGTHSDSVIVLEVPKGAVGFKAKAGLDDGGAVRKGEKTAASVRFLVRDPATPYLRPLPPGEKVATKYFAVEDDLEVTVWASTPQLFNPTNMDIDHKGRVWVAEGVNYRRHKGRRPGGDRITVLEDTDGDGRADSSHTFVQEKALVAPLGVAVFDNKIYVSQPPSLIVYTDVDRDLKFDPKVDKREEILTGFNARNHDHSLHSVTAGPDGKFYFNNGNTGAVFTDQSGKKFYMGSPYHGGGGTWFVDNVAAAGKKSDDGHVWAAGFTARMNPDGSDVEIVGQGYRNSYEQTFSSFGNAFQSDNDDPPACRVSYILEYGSAGYFTRDAKQFYSAVKRPGQSHQRAIWRQDDPGTMDAGDIYGGGSPTGVTMYENGALPKQYVGTLFVCEPGRNTIFEYHPKPKGATFTLDRTNFLTTNSEGKFVGSDFVGGGRATKEPFLFRPSDITVGPDGALYVCDWYDPRVGGHADLDDSTSGTVYRIAPKGFTPEIPEFDLKTIAGAVTALESPAINTRYLGFAALREQGAKALPAVEKLLQNDNRYLAARAIWLLPHLGEEGKAKCVSLLKNDDPQIRIAAYRALRRAETNKADILPYAKKMAADKNSGVRRDVALSLRDLPAEKTKSIFAELAKKVNPDDKNAIEAIGLGAANQESEIWLAIKAALKPGSPADWDARFVRLTWRLWPAAAVSDLKTRALSKKLTHKERAFAVESLAFIDDRKSVDAMLDLADKSDVKGEAASWLLKNGIGEWSKYDLGKELKKRGIYDPDSIKVQAITVAKPEGKPKFSVKDVLKLTGDAEKGKNTALRCIMCHKFNGTGPDYAPNLEDWGKGQTADVVARSIIKPSADISHGYKGTDVTLKNGEHVQGIALNAGDPLIVKSTGGITQMIPGKRIEKKNDMKRSLMLSADQLGLSPQDVADLTAFIRKK